MVPSRIRLVCLLLAAFLPAAAPANAAVETLYQAKIGIHLIPKPAKGTLCGVAPTEGFACNEGGYPTGSDLVLHGDLATSYYAYYILLDIDPTYGAAGVGFGIDYNGTPSLGVDLFGTEVCGDASFPDENFPNNPPAGITVTWDAASNCQRHVDPSDPQGQAAAVILGMYVYAYSDDTMWAVPRPGAPSLYNAEVSDCAGSESTIPYPCYMGRAGFGATGTGYSPCVDFIGPVEMTSWGRIKRFYGEVGGLAFPGDM